MRKLRSVRLIKFVAVALLTMVVVAPPSGADTGSVTATVTASTACITVEAASVDFGSLPFSTSDNNIVEFGIPDTNTAPEYTLTNCSSLEASFHGTGSNIFDSGSGQIIWYLDDTIDFSNPDICSDTSELTAGYTGSINRYYSSVVTDTNGSGTVGDIVGGNPDSGQFLAHNSSKVLAGASAVPGSGSITIGNQITMPCTGSDGAGETQSTSITYTAILNS